MPPLCRPLFLFRLLICQRLGAVRYASSCRVCDGVPHAHNHRNHNYGVFYSFQKNTTKSAPCGHVLPIQAQVGQHGQDDCSCNLHPKHRVLNSYFPVDLHSKHPFLFVILFQILDPVIYNLNLLLYHRHSLGEVIVRPYFTG